MEISNWLIIPATILGPILAVQAQKIVENVRQRKGQKLWVFHHLMATRAERVSPEHVKALNIIDLAFYGSRLLGISKRKKTEQSVLDAWHEYHDHLGTQYDENSINILNVKGDELFINLLYAISKDLGFKFDRVQLKKGAYSPVAHGNLELEQNALRRLAIKVLSGDGNLKMDIQSVPVNEEVLKSNIELHDKLSAALDGSGSLNVQIKR